MRRRLQGHAASRGSAMGRARVRLPHILDVEEQRITAAEVNAELDRLHDAIHATRKEMQDLRQRLHGALSQEVGEFLDLHALLLDDPELLQGLDELIRVKRYGAGFALRKQRDRLAKVFRAMDDPYLRARMDDLDHVIGRIHAHLNDNVVGPEGLAGEILVSDNVAPSELAHLQTQGVVAIVTAAGSPLSHSAILARSLHMPLVVGAAHVLQKINDGDALIVDGDSGEVVIDPDANDLVEFRQRLKDAAREQRELGRLRSKPSRTRDGVDITLYANAESREDIARAHALGAAGVGLYRTEFLFLRSEGLPDEETQFRVYRDAVLGMSGRVVTFRTLDLGADKADRAGLAVANEDNPALGVRGVRLTLAHAGVFDIQLRAILRASGYGPVRILVPMVSSREELISVRRRIRSATLALRKAGHVVADNIPLGAMIEVPAAAIAVASFADTVDFLSVGTNDLVQYLLAADRNNEALSTLYSPLHPGVLRLLRHIVRSAADTGTPVAVCGEIAGDPLMTPLLLSLGITELSLHPATLLEVRRRIRESDLSALDARLEPLLKARDRAGIERWLATCSVKA
jgi:phosphoenolpyruvate-protein phosphotransferase (PTS system enzyme I)